LCAIYVDDLPLFDVVALVGAAVAWGAFVVWVLAAVSRVACGVGCLIAVSRVACVVAGCDVLPLLG
jgi:amino acid transporter